MGIKVVLYHVGDSNYAAIAAKSAQKLGYEVVFLTDLVTQSIDGCEVIREEAKSPYIIVERMRRYAEYNQPGIYIDSDIVIRKDLSPIWALDFDAAVTRRDHPIISEQGIDVSQRMPINTGVIFMRNPRFFPRIYELMQQFGEPLQKWWGDQVAIAEIVKHFNCVHLPVNIYNCTYKPEETNAWVWHFKGERKDAIYRSN